MPVDQPGPAAPKASVNAPRAGSGPKRPPRPERTAPAAPAAPANGTSAVPAVSEAGASPADVRSTLTDAFPLRDEPPAMARPEPEPEVEPVVATRKGTRRGRRVKRVVRRIDLWSVLKLSLLVYTCLYFATLATLAALWGILYSSGNVEKLQSFLEDVGLENFTFYGNQMFRACAAIGAVGVMAGTVVTVLATALVNLISEMTGGIRLVVIEEEVTR